MRRIVLIAVAGLWLVAAPADARPGDLDRSFGAGGRIGFPGGGSPNGLVLTDGLRPLLSVMTAPRPVWLQLGADGRKLSRVAIPPPALEAPYLASGYGLAASSDWESLSSLTLSRVDADEAVVLNVPPPFKGLANNFGVDAAGRVILPGYQTGTARTVALRYLPTGELDPSYGTNGIAELGALRGWGATLVKPDGRAYFTDGARFMALDASGRSLSGFAQGRRSVAGQALVLVAGPGGTLLVGGWEGDTIAFLARLRGDGRLDTRFGRRGTVRGLDLSLADLARDRRGRIIAAGSRFDSENGYDATVYRFTARGRLDRSFATRGRKVFTLANVKGVDIIGSAVRQIAVDRRGRIVLAGASYDDAFELREDVGQPYPAIARLKG